MKITMRIGVAVVIMLLGLQASAQTFGIRGGLNLSKMLIKDDDEKYSTEFSMKPGFHGGLTFQYDFSDVIALETALLFESKGVLYKDEFSGVAFKEKINILYIDMGSSWVSYFANGILFVWPRKLVFSFYPF